ncbi:MAG: hypothetical protein K6U80_19150 [Firmicutes bacterium]|nr:hypothetical protein [Bacillota bacterium]
MSLTQHAFLKRNEVPSRNEWQENIVKLGFNMSLDPELKPFEDSGFIPCKFNSLDSGFEINYEEINNVIENYPHLKNKVENKDYCITFNWGGDLSECACVLIASLAIKEMCDAIIYYPDDDMLLTKEELKAQINQCFELIK